MLKWLKKLVVPAEEPHQVLSADEAVRALQMMVSDAVVDEIYEGLDTHAAEVSPEVRQMVMDGQLGAYPLNTAIIWLAYQEGNNDRILDDELRSKLEESLKWAFQFELNTVLLGAALGTLDGLTDADREDTALRLFEGLKDVSPRRYWLILKVKTPRFLEAVAAGLAIYNPEDRPKMAGAFRQFKAADLENVLAYLDVPGEGAEMLVEALRTIDRPEARAKLQELTESDSENVSAAAKALVG